MKIAISGARGLVGTALLPRLTAAGHEVLRLVRSSPTSAAEIGWDPSQGVAQPERLSGVDAVVHLAGENIAGGRWSPARMRRIRDSRVVGTRKLAEALAGLEGGPRTLVCASAIGFFGDRGAEVLDEGSPAGEGFLAEVCQEWEAAADPAREAGMRVVHLRIGVVLSAAGGALEKMLTPFRFGMGGVVGNGRQYWSWIELDDLARAIVFALEEGGLHGPVAAVAPHPVTNFEFTKALGRVLHRPTIAPLPAPAARLVLGKMADGLLLASARVLPRKLEDAGFRFQEPELEGALRRALGRPAPAGIPA